MEKERFVSKLEMIRNMEQSVIRQKKEFIEEIEGELDINLSSILLSEAENNTYAMAIHNYIYYGFLNTESLWQLLCMAMGEEDELDTTAEEE